MGLFLTMLTCKISSRDTVSDALVNIMEERRLTLEYITKANEITGKENQYEITNQKNGWVQVFCPETPDDKLASSLSKKLNTPVFQFHIHNGEFWMYQLFVSGELKDKHNPIPDYWKKISEKERETWNGKASTLTSIFGISGFKIEPYLILWGKDKGDNNSKAFPDDEFPVMSEWSMVDFQKKFGIIYPDFEKPETLDLLRLNFRPKKFWEKMFKKETFK